MNIKVRAQGKDRAEITIYGIIGQGFFEDGVTAEKVRKDLKALGDVKDIDVFINSPGGNVWDGLAVTNMLVAHSAQIHVQIEGVAASIASVIAMAGDNITMASGALMMIHSPNALFAGTADELREFAEVLDKVEASMLDIYEARTETPRAEVLELLKAETWFTAQEAVDAGFADDLIEAKSPSKPEASWQTVMACFKHIPEDFDTPQKPAGSKLSAVAGAIPTKEGTMKDNKAPASVQDTDTAVAEAAEKARKEELKRVSGITALCSKYEMDAAFLQTAIDEEHGLDKVNAAILELKYQSTKGGTAGHVELTEDEHEKMRGQATQWLVSRAGLGKHDADNPFRGMTIEGIARECLDASGVRTRGMGRAALIKAAISHTTSDFPNIFENALHKSMLGGFEAAAPVWPRFCRTSGLSDFREHIRYRMGSFTDLAVVLESGEYQDGTMGDAERETITGISKGRILNISREMLINDDMSVFSNVASFLGQAAARTLDKDVISLFDSNGPTMGDGTVLFHADHNNIAAVAVAPTMAAFEAGRVAMASQLDPDTNDYVGAIPSIWLGPLSLGGQARQTNAAEYDDDSQKNQRKPNVVRGLVSDIVDTPRLPANIWYLLADPAVDPVFEVGFLDGVEVPVLVMEEAFRTYGMSWRITYDYGYAAVGFRGIQKNPGV